MLHGHVTGTIPWSNTTTKILLDFYKKYRCLWDKNHKDYGKKDVQRKVVAPLLVMLQKSKPPHTEDQVKKRWHSLRSSILRYAKKDGPESEIK